MQTPATLLVLRERTRGILRVHFTGILWERHRMFPTSRMWRRRALISSASAFIFAGTLSQYASGQTADSSSTQHPKAHVDPGLTYQMQTDPLIRSEERRAGNERRSRPGPPALQDTR